MGRPAQTSRAEILQTALAIADEHGLDAVTMQAVARRLGVTAMALYRHVTNKDGLLDGLVELLLTGLPRPPADLPWSGRLVRFAEGMREIAARHSGVFLLLLQRPARTDAALDVRNSVTAALREAGLRPEDAARAERLLSTAVFGFAASEAAGRFTHHDKSVRDADFAFLVKSLRGMVNDMISGMVG